MKPLISQGVTHSLLKKLNIATALGLVVLTAGVTSTALFAAATSNFQFTINAGTLSVDIVDGAYATVGSPTVVFSAASTSFVCQAVTGTFGTATQQIYVRNPDAADNGWAVSLAASTPTAFWDSAGTDVDFNDPTAAGCTEGTDADALVGQLSVDPSGGTFDKGACLGGCNTTGVTKGTASAYNEGTVDSITLLSGAAGSSDIGDWYLRGVALSQTIAAEQPAASDYDINMTLSVVAS